MPHKYKYNPTKPEVIENRINEYFDNCDKNGIIPLYPELLLYLDITRNTWDSYATVPDIDNIKYNQDKIYKASIDNKKQVAEIIKKAEQRLEAGMAREAMKTGKAAAIFMLKQKFYGGYQDKQQTEISGNVPIKVTIQTADGKTLDG